MVGNKTTKQQVDDNTPNPHEFDETSVVETEASNHTKMTSNNAINKETIDISETQTDEDTDTDDIYDTI